MFSACCAAAVHGQHINAGLKTWKTINKGLSHKELVFSAIEVNTEHLYRIKANDPKWRQISQRICILYIYLYNEPWTVSCTILRTKKTSQTSNIMHVHKQLYIRLFSHNISVQSLIWHRPMTFCNNLKQCRIPSVRLCEREKRSEAHVFNWRRWN